MSDPGEGDDENSVAPEDVASGGTVDEAAAHDAADAADADCDGEVADRVDDADEVDHADEANSGEADDESEWQFSLQDLERREADAEAAAEAERRRKQPLEPGDPSLENAVFVLLGVLFALFIISRLFAL